MNARAQEYLLFSLGNDQYAISVEQIREIIEYSSLTVIPGLPAFLRGLINLRGTVVPVVDMQARIGKPATRIRRRTCIVIVQIQHEGEEFHMGLLVDAVVAVIELEQSRVEAAPSFGLDMRSDFVKTMLNLEARFIVELNLQNLLSIGELSRLIEYNS